ncbi:MAG: hypothetical protein ACHQT6_06280 [Candidatus Acidiferrales bacterium]
MSRKSRRVDAGVLTGLVMAGAVIWIVLASAPKSNAIPAFSRKYQTSCTTCHNNYPELNDFGEAFKKNGFKFPKDDDVFVKQDPVMLGSKAQKEAFPEAVYPGEIPGTIPISFRYEGNFNWNAKQPAPVVAGGGYVPRTDLFVPNTVTVIAAGSFGPNFSFWIDDDLSAGGSGANGGLGDGWLKYNDLGRIFHLPTNSLNVRFGQFEPDLPFTQARTYYLSGFDVFNQANVAQNLCPALPLAPNTVCQTANNGFILGTPQRGIEFGGTPNNGNFNWSVAITDGTGSSYGGSTSLVTRNTKDVYLRASYKFNLERDPESRKAIQAAGPTGPRDHTSIRVGGFYYYGTNQQNFGGTSFGALGLTNTLEEPFYRAGGDLRFKYRHLELFAVGVVGHDDNHFLTVDSTGLLGTLTPARAVTFTGGFVGGNYWIYPWLIATMRYDFVNSPSDFANGASRYQTRNAFRPGYQILLRANVKIVGEYDRTWQPASYGNDASGNPLFYRPNTFITGIDYVF